MRNQKSYWESKRYKNPLKESERNILYGIKQYLQLIENSGKLIWIRNNTGAISVGNEGSKRFIRFGRQGSPDLIVFLQGGKTIFLEVKRKGACQTKEQREFEQKVRELGYDYFVVSSVEEVICIISHNIQ